MIEDELGRPLFPLTLRSGWILGSVDYVAYGGTDREWQVWRSRAFRQAHPEVVEEIKQELRERLRKIKSARPEEGVESAPSWVWKEREPEDAPAKRLLRRKQ